MPPDLDPVIMGLAWFLATLVVALLFRFDILAWRANRSLRAGTGGLWLELASASYLSSVTMGVLAVRYLS